MVDLAEVKKPGIKILPTPSLPPNALKVELTNNGEEVFLCWKEGEEDIEYWHSLSAGYKGRRPITEF